MQTLGGVDSFVNSIMELTGRWGDAEKIRSSIKTVLASLHAQNYLLPDLRSGVVDFGASYRICKVSLDPRNFGHLRKIKQVRHCAEYGDSGLPLGTRIPPADFDSIVTQSVAPGDYYSVENRIMTIRSTRPINRVWVSWYTFPTVSDPLEDWIFQRYEELVKLRTAAWLESTYGASDRVSAHTSLAGPLLSALLSDNADSNAES